MNGAPIESSLARIEAALARIESAATGPSRAQRDLELRHERLRAAVAQSLRQLDDLMAQRGS